MSILTRRRRRSRGGEGRRGRAGRPPLAALLGVAALLLNGAAQAQSVSVDLGALDSLPPETAKPDGPTIRLHPPRKAEPARKAPAVARKAKAKEPGAPRAAAATAQPAKVAPAPQTTAAKPPSAAPEAPVTLPGMPQIPPAPVLPPPPDLAPAAAKSAAAKPAPAKTATTAAQPEARPTAAPPGTAPAEPTTLRLVFPAGASQLPADAKAVLDRCAERLAGDPRLRAVIDAYAAAGDASQARRLSLSRALAARGYLVARGVDVKQVDVRPLGNRTEPGLPPDRVDLVIAGR